MNGRLLAAFVVLAVLVALLLRGSGGAVWAPYPPAPGRTGAAPPRPRLPRPEATPREPSRNLFEYAEGGTPLASPGTAPLMRTPSAAMTAAPPVATPAPVRVAGLIRRGGDLKAAIVVDGEMTLAGRGERAGGYTVLEVSDETGVRVRGPDGRETLLPPPPF